MAYDKDFFEKSLEDNFWKFRFYVRVYVILHPWKKTYFDSMFGHLQKAEIENWGIAEEFTDTILY